jgi:hypothetical protein
MGWKGQRTTYMWCIVRMWFNDWEFSVIFKHCSILKDRREEKVDNWEEGRRRRRGEEEEKEEEDNYLSESNNSCVKVDGFTSNMFSHSFSIKDHPLRHLSKERLIVTIMVIKSHLSCCASKMYARYATVMQVIVFLIDVLLIHTVN